MNEDCCKETSHACLSEVQAMGRVERSLTEARPFAVQEPCCEGPCDIDEGPCEIECDEDSPCACGGGGPCGSKEDSGKIRDVKINQVNYGYIVKIGCHTFVFETAERLIEKLGVKFGISSMALHDSFFSSLSILFIISLY
jgi:hypothetical protein